MRAVIYHAEGTNLWDAPEGAYKKLFEGFKENVKRCGLDTIHLTLEGHEGWGDVNYYYEGLKPKNVVYNREVCFTKFLMNAQDDVYWFTEPDARIEKPIPPIGEEIDLVLLYRPNDDVALTPSFRIARKTAWPWFVETLEEMKKQPENTWDWHGDSFAWVSMYKKLGKPKQFGVVRYSGVNIELREYG